MATLVRCIEGHAFDMAASETCPICGSTVWKNEPVVKNKPPPWDRTKAKQAAVVIGYLVASIVFIGVTINIAHNIWTSNFVKSVTKNVEEHTHPPPPPRTDEEIRKSILKKLGAGGQPDDKNTASQPTTKKEIPNPFAPPKLGNPSDNNNPFDKNVRF
jgi:hypothetical protein